MDEAMKAAEAVIKTVDHERSDDGNGMTLDAAIALVVFTLATEIDKLRSDIESHLRQESGW